jgi:hypothetical protein
MDDDDAGWGYLLTRPPELSGSPTSRDFWDKYGRRSENFAFSVSEIPLRIFNMP